ncbi:hypothetical protein [Pseudomonas sp. GR 6-02]|uniref:hypothetical protein n=1 Tax=Pseudomonas sp. GR 6-02 TaxID=1659194 RepID=UPI0012E73283|nr:hypothetical protein [Pseudomonas sp. GR 6-02]
MSTIVMRSWRRLRDLPVLRYVMLFFIPIFARPLHFSKGTDRPLYTRLKGLMTLPIFVATLWQSTALSMYQWLGKRESERIITGISQGDIWDHLHSTQGWVGLAALVATTLSIYTIAILRWGYHTAAVSICQKLDFKCMPISLLYFIVTTAAWGLWIGLLMKGIDYSLWLSNGNLSGFFNELSSKHPHKTLGLLFIVGLAMYRASINSSHGMISVYAHSRILAWVVGFLPIILLSVAVYALETLA